MKLYSLLTITYVAAKKNQEAIDRATAIEHWDVKGTCDLKHGGYASKKCDNDDGWCCHGDDTSDACLPNIVESLQRNFEYKHAERKDKEQEWWCMVPREKRTAKERAQIEKCLKSFDPSNYNTDHGKIGFFHRLLSKIVAERIDRPFYQCNTITKLRENFVDYLKLRKSCAKETSAWKKKQNAKAKKEAERDEKEAERKVKKEAAKEKKQAKKAEKLAEKADDAVDRKRREDETEEDFYFDENNKSEVVDADADAELSSLFESLMQLEDNDQMTIEDLQAFFDSDCTGDDIDVDMCQEVANILSVGADTRSEEQKDSMEILIKVSKSRRGIVSWSKSFIPADLTKCRKKRNKLNMKTRSYVSRILDMRKRFNTNPDKLAAARRQKKEKITAKSLRIETAKNRAAEKKQKEQDKKERKADKAAAEAERLANKAEREEALAERTAKQEAKAAEKAAKAAEAESTDAQE